MSTNTWFYRGSLSICDVIRSPDGWSWVGMVGVPKGHPCHGDLFISRATGPALEHVIHKIGIRDIDTNWWWFSFEGTCAEEWPTTVEVQLAADEFNAMVPI